jgi:predicted ATPase/class 3 adenylate cyclase
VGELPGKTITMLFTDIEGSTALLDRLGDRYEDALSAHRALIRAALATWNGRELSTEGDSFFAVFGSAHDAVCCALAAQQALAGYDWPGGVAVRVRMGLHSGAPTEYEGSYIGMDVHRAARISAAAHGGQVVLSEPTRLLAASDFPAGVSVRDLGFHRLKDIPETERIYELAGPGLENGFPPLKSLGAQTSLPVPATLMVGRDDDLTRLRAALVSSGVRLVTLTGPGGVGKTRLSLAAAIALAHSFPHGVYFVALAAARDAEVMWKTLADSLGGSSEGPAIDVVTGYLAGRRALLVLDNLEQLEGAGEVVAGLLAAAPSLVILASSRRPLHVQGEHEFPVPTLEVPGGGGLATVTASGAAQLFAQRAAMVRPGFAITAENAADVAAICRHLDGLPLAIELAAARVKLLAPRALLARLGHGLGLASAEAGRPLRQQTLRNTVAWSYELLPPDVARVFRRMSVFAGGCDLAALDAVAVGAGDPAAADALELVAELQDVSLIRVTEDADGEPRLGMLETIREYAMERLAREDDRDGTQRRHAQHYARSAERARDQLEGPAQLTALDQLEADHDNLRAALTWSLEPPVADMARDGERTVLGLRLVEALTFFWYQRGHAAEAQRWLHRAMDVASPDGGAPLAQVLHGLGMLMDTQAEPEAARLLFERSLAIWRELGDRDQQARNLNSLGIVNHHLGDLPSARSALQECIAIAREIGSALRLAPALTSLGQLESASGHFEVATQVLGEALALDLEQGDLLGVALDRHSLALVSLRAGRLDEARELLSGTFDYVASSGNILLLANILEMSAAITAERGDPLHVARLTGAADAMRQQAVTPRTNQEAALMERYLAAARTRIAPHAWAAELAAGQSLTWQESVMLLRSATPDPRPERDGQQRSAGTNSAGASSA